MKRESFGRFRKSIWKTAKKSRSQSKAKRDLAYEIPYIDSAADFSDIAVAGGILDLAVNIDHYLYGLPKQTKE